MRKETSPTGGIIFSVVKIIGKTNKNNNIHFEVDDELSDFKNDNVQYKRTIQRVSEIDTIKKKQILAEKQTTENSIEMIDESAKSQDFFQDNNPSEMKYTTKRIKSINFFVKYCLCWY